MSNSLPLRPYQVQAVEAVERAWSEGMLRPAVVLPTGTGKTVVFSHLITRFATTHPDSRIAVLVHRDELARQAVDKIRSVSPDLDVGIVKAEQNQVDARVIVASVQTLARSSRRAKMPNIDMVVADECHHAAAPSWMEVLRHLGSFDDTPTVGFTATMVREDDRGLGDVWQDVVYTKSISFGILNGYLTDVRAHQITVDGLNLAQVARSRGDFQEGALGEALVASGAGPVVAKAYLEHAGERQGLMFTPTVACAREFAEDFNRAGIPTEVVTGGTPLEQRAEVFLRYRRGEIRVISNALVLTEGFDMPQAEVAVLARPTQSTGLFQQIVGRVLRPWPGKTEALVLDVVGATLNNSLASIVDLSETKVPVEEGESLKEAWSRSEAEKANIERDVLEGTVTHAVKDLFSASRAAWLQTPGGIWFIPAGKKVVFLWPDTQPGLFKIGRCSSTTTSDGEWLKSQLTLEYALAWGEEIALETDQTVADRQASWRRRKAKPTDAQKEYASRLGIPYTEKTRKNELSDLISIKLVSRLLDPR